MSNNHATDTATPSPQEPEVLFEWTNGGAQLQIVGLPVFYEPYYIFADRMLHDDGVWRVGTQIDARAEALLSALQSARDEAEALKGKVREYLKAGDDYAESFRNPWANASALADQHQKKCDILDDLRAAVEQPQRAQQPGGGE